MAVGYLAALTSWIYAIAEPQVGYGSDVAAVATLIALVALHLATGWAIGRWWAVFLPLVPIVIALPAGTPTKGEDPYAIWWAIAWYVAPAGAFLILLTVALRRAVFRPIPQ